MNQDDKLDAPAMHLTADGLASKWGFNDGDMPDHVWDYFDDAGRLEDVDDWHTILRRLVRTHLVPLLPEGVEVYDIETNHNPIRTDHWGPAEGDEEKQVPDIGVEVTLRDILAAIEEERA